MLFKFQFLFLIPLLLGLTTATLSGPYLMWGQEKLHDLQAPALTEASEQNLATLFKDSKAVIVFLRNNTNRLDGASFPKFQQFIKHNTWSYLPQHSLAAEPFNYNANVEIIPLSGLANEEDDELMNGFHDAVTIYGEGEVLGILANREEEAHFLSKREAKETEDEATNSATTTTSPTASNIPLVEETDEGFIYVADGKKAILYVNAAPVLNLSSFKESLILVSHNKVITFDDQRSKGYGRLNVNFHVKESQRVYLRFNFTLSRGTWSMTAVEVEFNSNKTVLRAVGNSYTIPSAPLGFSYRCSSQTLIFRNGEESLVLKDFQVQPWLNGASRFGDVYDCVGFTTSPIWAGVLVSFFLLGILSLGIIMLLDIKTPNRFESSRSKQLTFTVQE